MNDEWQSKYEEMNLIEILVYLFLFSSQQTLYHREAESIVRSIVNNILDNVRTPERSRSPVGFYMTEQEEFQQKNPDVRSMKRFRYDRFIIRFSSILITKSLNKSNDCTNKSFKISFNVRGIYPSTHYAKSFFRSTKIIHKNKIFSNN